MNNFFSSRGSAIFGSLVGAGLLAGLAISITKMSDFLRQGQVTTETKLETQDLQRSVLNVLSNRFHCQASLHGISLGERVRELRYSTGTSFLSVEKIYGLNRVLIKDMTLIDRGEKVPQVHAAELVITLQGTSKDAKNPIRPVSFPMVVELSGGRVISCIADLNNNLEAACESLGGSYDTGKCLLPKCPSGQYLRGFHPDGTVECFYPLANVSCPAGQLLQGFDGTGSAICVSPN